MSTNEASTPTAAPVSTHDKLLFVGCFVALITTSFGFILRAMLISEWGVEFGLTEVEKGEIFGVGLWPFAISIVLFSLVIDKIGYGKAMAFAFICHIGSAILTITATNYWSLWISMFVVALGNGTVEAVINPVVATMFSREKTKWLNILHAGWPAGLVFGGMLVILLGGLPWQWKIGILAIPTLLYGVILLRCKFPVQERVAAGVSHREMLRETGGLGMFVILFLIFSELGRVAQETGVLAGIGIAEWAWYYTLVIAGALAGGFGFWVGSAGRPMFVFLLLIMIPLATTELGTDSWITPLMEGEMKAIGLNAVWVLIYTSAIMMLLRLFAGPIVHRLQPLGLLAVSAALAALGLICLSVSTGLVIFAAATLYGLGKTFFWPTMLGIVSERFPRGGALTLNATGGVGMLSVGVVGTVFLGYWQDTTRSELLEERSPTIYAEVVTEKPSVLGAYHAVDPEKVAREVTAPLMAAQKVEMDAAADLERQLGHAPSEEELAAALEKSAVYQAVIDRPAYQKAKEEQALLDATLVEAQKQSLARVAIFPVIMLLCYLGLMAYFKARGGYGAEVLEMSTEAAT